jgi:hypothetical protein
MFTLESFVMNERAEGGASQFVANARDLMGDAHFDPGLMRPYRDDRGRASAPSTILSSSPTGVLGISRSCS